VVYAWRAFYGGGLGVWVECGEVGGDCGGGGVGAFGEHGSCARGEEACALRGQWGFVVGGG